MTSQSYKNDGFWFDFLILFPWRLLIDLIFGLNLHIIYIIKCSRLVVLNKYLNKANLKKMCGALFDHRFHAILEDPYMSQDFRNDRTIIKTRMIFSSLTVSIKILLYTILALYFTGVYWFCFSLVFFEWSGHVNIENFFIDNVLSLSLPEKILRSFYFALTTLSTVGFGDFYPKSDLERILGSLVILFGVALFSIIIGEFLDMIDFIQSIDKPSTEDEKLQMFFNLIQ